MQHQKGMEGLLKPASSVQLETRVSCSGKGQEEVRRMALRGAVPGEGGGADPAREEDGKNRAGAAKE